MATFFGRSSSPWAADQHTAWMQEDVHGGGLIHLREEEGQQRSLVHCVLWEPLWGSANDPEGRQW